MWYPRHALQFRIALFWGGATIAGAFSGALAFAISFMAGEGGKEGWSWIFILEGLATIVVGLVALSGEYIRSEVQMMHNDRISAVMVDFPDTAPFLSAAERQYVQEATSMRRMHL